MSAGGVAAFSAAAAVRATYRLQLHAGFPLGEAARRVPYLARLGVSHVYASPLLRARRGSLHGYDLVDPATVCPERGGEAGLATLHEALRRHDMGLVLDIVPNHMGIGAENPRWDDVLAHGRASRFAHWFDVDWEAGDQRVVLPVLGDPLGRVLDTGALHVSYVPDRGFRLRYFEHDWPLDPATTGGLVARAGRRVGGAAGSALADAARALAALPPRHPEARDRGGQAEAALGRLAAARVSGEASRAIVAETDDLARPAARGRLELLLRAQAYRLVHWRRGGRLVNYRRFFTIADLVGVRVEDSDVFEGMHACILDLVAAGVVQGLRVDHVDGLRDPHGYLERLRDAATAARPHQPTPIWVEKILCGDERLRRGWPVAGTTGYEAANLIEAALIAPGGYAEIEEWYRRSTAGGPRRLDLATIVDGGKRRVLGTWLAADVRRLARRALLLLASDVGLRDAERALVETIVALPIYRTYVPPPGEAADETDAALLAAATGTAVARGRARPDVVRALGRVLAGDVPDVARPLAREVVARFQQLSPPAMAKGFEDTALYVFVPLASRNEVGGSPGAPLEDATARLHTANAERLAAWPEALVTVSTHDTKRSADVRARLDVLAEIAPRWIRTVAGWRRRHRRHRTRLGRRLVPDDNTEYLLYQSMVGIWPAGAGTAWPSADLRERLVTQARKAAREAKVHTSWLTPDPAFEGALLHFLGALLADETFVAALGDLVDRIAPSSRWNALARTLVHLTVPGIPDVYQGDELWSHALADPDNRLAVDFDARERALGSLERGVEAAGLLRHATDGICKLHVVRAALAARRRTPAPFALGAYDALVADGHAAAHLFAFARRHGNEVAVTVVPRLVHALSGGAPPAGAAVWRDTTLRLPGLAGRTLTDAMTGRPHRVSGDERLLLADVLATFPVALLLAAP